MKNISVISSMKLRYSYGAAGNNRIDNNLFRTLYESSSSKQYYLNESASAYIYQSHLTNPALKWETTFTRDGGHSVSYPPSSNFQS